MNPTDLFFIVLSAVIVGGGLVAISTVTMVRYTRAEDAGQRPKFGDIFFVLIAIALAIFGAWRAGIFT